MPLAVWEGTAKTTASAGETINLTYGPKGYKKLVAITALWTAGTAPAASENLTFTLKSGEGTVYDEVLFEQDASTYGGGIVSIS